jgi:competence protein ComEA
MTDRQITGSVLLLLLAFIISYLSAPGTLKRSQDISIPCSEQVAGRIVIELDGAERNAGIYFLSDGASVSDLLAVSGQQNSYKIDRRALDTMLISGYKVSVNSPGDQAANISIGRIETSKRLALDMPIDLNSATVDDLILISGIGEKTAEKIVNYRTGIGKFRKLEQLKNVKGIKEKKFAKLSKYFYLETKNKI